MSTLIGHAFLTPLIFITLILTPLFYSKLIEYNNIKRIGCAGITKEQFSLIIILTNLALIIVLALIAFGPINLLLEQIHKSLFKVDTFHNNKLYLINYSDLKLAFFIPTYFISIIMFTQLGLLFARKTKTVKTTLLLGLLIYVVLDFGYGMQRGGNNEFLFSFSVDDANSKSSNVALFLK